MENFYQLFMEVDGITPFIPTLLSVESFLQGFGIGADILSYVSLGLTIPTLVLSVTTSKAVSNYAEKRSFREHIPNNISSLRVHHSSISNDDVKNVNKFLIDLSEELDKIIIGYPNVTKDFKKDIAELRNLLESTVENSSFRSNRHKITVNLHTVITHLENSLERVL